jgi:uncharacterized protein (TIGR00251 family)
MTTNVSRISVRLQPRSSRDEILGWQKEDAEGALRVCVKAPPVDGAANKALVQLLAKTLSIRKSNITLVSGATVRNKIIEVEGLTVDELRNRLIRP